MGNKITWQDIYKEFRSGHPNLCKKIIGWQPNGYLSIIVSLDDGDKMAYDYLTKRCWFVR